MVCIGGIAGTAFAALPYGSLSGTVYEDGGVMPIATTPLVADDGDTAADAQSGSSADLAVNAPLISGVTATNITGAGATITWATDEAATTQVEYGLTEEYGSLTDADANLVNSHSAALTGLKAGKTYHYRVISKEAAGNQKVSADRTFTTPIGKPPSLLLPIWAWAVVGVIGVLGVGALVILDI